MAATRTQNNSIFSHNSQFILNQVKPVLSENDIENKQQYFPLQNNNNNSLKSEVKIPNQAKIKSNPSQHSRAYSQHSEVQQIESPEKKISRSHKSASTEPKGKVTLPQIVDTHVAATASLKVDGQENEESHNKQEGKTQKSVNSMLTDWLINQNSQISYKDIMHQIALNNPQSSMNENNQEKLKQNSSQISISIPSQTSIKQLSNKQMSSGGNKSSQFIRNSTISSKSSILSSGEFLVNPSNFSAQAKLRYDARLSTQLQNNGTNESMNNDDSSPKQNQKSKGQLVLPSIAAKRESLTTTQEQLNLLSSKNQTTTTSSSSQKLSTIQLSKVPSQSKYQFSTINISSLETFTPLKSNKQLNSNETMNQKLQVQPQIEERSNQKLDIGGYKSQLQSPYDNVSIKNFEKYPLSQINSEPASFDSPIKYILHSLEKEKKTSIILHQPIQFDSKHKIQQRNEPLVVQSVAGMEQSRSRTNNNNNEVELLPILSSNIKTKSTRKQSEQILDQPSKNEDSSPVVYKSSQPSKGILKSIRFSSVDAGGIDASQKNDKQEQLPFRKTKDHFKIKLDEQIKANSSQHINFEQKSLVNMSPFNEIIKKKQVNFKGTTKVISIETPKETIKILNPQSRINE